MKKTTLILLSALLVLFAGSVWGEEDEFPLEITCYVEDGIIQFHFEETVEDSWYLFDKEIMPFGMFAKFFFRGNNKMSSRKSKSRFNKFAGKKLYDFKELEVSNTYIYFERDGLFHPYMRWIINRLTGSFTQFRLEGWVGESHPGQCYPGLEIITKKKF